MFGISRAPEIDRPGLVWFNTPKPLSLNALAGRIAILDFWTYCCINCMQVLPTLDRIERSFPTEVAVVGIHSPKFPAERQPQNVAQAIARYGIRHPVVHDPMMTLWQEYGVRAWPTLVFLSPDGYVIGQLPGEPDPEALLQGIGDMVREFTERGELRPAVLEISVPAVAGGRLRFPGKIKACPAGPRASVAEPAWAIADAGHHQIALFDNAGVETARFGSGQAGFDDGAAERASFRAPQGLACDRESIWVADTGNHALRRIDRASGEVSTIAGLGRRGAPLRMSEPAEGTPLASPWDVERVGGTLVFANAGTHQIGRYDLLTREVCALAGSGAEGLLDGPAESAQLAQPSGLAATADGQHIYFADAESSAIRKLSLGPDRTVSTLVGQGLFTFGYQNGRFEETLLQHPLGVAVHDGTLLVADSYNGLIRQLSLASHQVDDLEFGDCADPLCMPAGEPSGVAVAGNNRLLISDTNNHRVIEIDLARGRYRTWAA